MDVTYLTFNVALVGVLRELHIIEFVILFLPFILLFLLFLLNEVYNCKSDGEGIKDVCVRVHRELFIGWNLKLPYELMLILYLFADGTLFLEAKRVTERGEEIRYLLYWNESRGLQKYIIMSKYLHQDQTVANNVRTNSIPPH